MRPRRVRSWGGVRRGMSAAASSTRITSDALARARRIALAEPTRPQVWRELADALDGSGDRAAAAAAYLEHVRHALHDAALMRAAAALHANDIPGAEARLRSQLKQAPTDIVAIRMLAEVALRLDRAEDAERLLTRCLDL